MSSMCSVEAKNSLEAMYAFKTQPMSVQPPRDVVFSASPPQRRAEPWTRVLSAVFVVLAFVGCVMFFAGRASSTGSGRIASSSLRHSASKVYGISGRRDPYSQYAPSVPFAPNAGPGLAQRVPNKPLSVPHMPRPAMPFSAPGIPRTSMYPSPIGATSDTPQMVPGMAWRNEENELFNGGVLLLKDDGVTEKHVVYTLTHHIPGMSQVMAEEIYARAESTGLALVGRWSPQLAEAYMRILRVNGLQSQIKSYATPEAPDKVVIPDTFNPAEWSRRGGGLGEGGGLGGSGVNFGNDGGVMEREQEGKSVAVLDRPPAKGDPGKKYTVLLFSDKVNDKGYAAKVLAANIPGMTLDYANEVARRAWNTGMGMVGIWTYELAEAYMDLLRSNGLQSEIEEV